MDPVLLIYIPYPSTSGLFEADQVNGRPGQAHGPEKTAADAHRQDAVENFLEPGLVLRLLLGQRQKYFALLFIAAEVLVSTFLTRKRSNAPGQAANTRGAI